MPKQRQKNEEKEEIRTEISSFTDSKALIEEVWFEGRPSLQVHYFDGSKDRILDEIITSQTEKKICKLVPADNDNLSKGTVIIPDSNLDLEQADFRRLWTLQDKLLDVGFDYVEQKQEAQLMMRICTSGWFIDKEETGIAGMGKFAPILAIRGLSGGGKNRFLNMLRWCSYHPFYQLSTNKIPSIYRPLELWKGALALDECDVDPLKDKDLVGLLLSRTYGSAISRQNPNNIQESNSFNNFHISIAAQRKPWGENALEGRTIPYYSEKSWSKLPTLETPEMIDLGKEIQKISLGLRLKYWNQVTIEKAMWLDTNDARLNSALLPLAALSTFDPAIMKLLSSLLKKIERRKVSLKAQSEDGLLVNYLHSKVEDGLYRPYNGGLTSYVLEAIIEQETVASKEGKDAKETVEVPLTTTRLKDNLGFSSAKEVRNTLDGMMHLDDLPDTVRLGGKKVRAVFFRNQPLLKLFREFVPDFDLEKCPLNRAALGLDKFAPQSKQKTSGGTDGTEGTVSSMPSNSPTVTKDTSGTVPSVPSVPIKDNNQVEKSSAAKVARIVYPVCSACGKNVGMGNETIRIYHRKKYCQNCYPNVAECEDDKELRESALRIFRQISGELKQPVEDKDFYADMAKLEFTQEQIEKIFQDMWKTGVIFETKAHFFKMA